MILVLAAVLAAQQGALPPYGASLRCAGLVEARMRLVSQDSAEWEQLYDAALFWGLAASEAARKNGLASKRFTTDQIEQRALAFGELRAESPKAKTELSVCLKRVKPVS